MIEINTVNPVLPTGLIHGVQAFHFDGSHRPTMQLEKVKEVHPAVVKHMIIRLNNFSPTTYGDLSKEVRHSIKVPN